MIPEARHDAWPALPLAEWRDSYATLHLYTQIVGKTRLTLAPMENHWWQVVLYVTARGLTTSPMPFDRRTVQVDFDFVDHQLLARTSDGASASLALVPRTVADFYDEYMKLLHGLGVSVKIWSVPVELPEVIPFAKDSEHRSYDPEAVNRFWRVLVQSERVMREFRGRFMGKASPVQFFWGSFDLAATRFSGRAAPPHPGGAPNVGDTYDESQNPGQGASGVESSLYTPTMTLERIHAINLAEIGAAKLAESNGSRAIRPYAQKLIKDHEKADTQVKQLAKKQGLTLRAPEQVTWPAGVAEDMQQGKQMMDQMKSLHGPEFDKQYLSMMVEGHGKALAFLGQAKTQVQDPAVVKLIGQLEPVVQEHQTMAQQLLEKENAPKVQGRR